MVLQRERWRANLGVLTERSPFRRFENDWWWRFDCRGEHSWLRSRLAIIASVMNHGKYRNLQSYQTNISKCYFFHQTSFPYTSPASLNLLFWSGRFDFRGCIKILFFSFIFLIIFCIWFFFAISVLLLIRRWLVWWAGGSAAKKKQHSKAIIITKREPRPRGSTEREKERDVGVLEAFVCKRKVVFSSSPQKVNKNKMRSFNGFIL